MAWMKLWRKKNRHILVVIYSWVFDLSSEVFSCRINHTDETEITPHPSSRFVESFGILFFSSPSSRSVGRGVPNVDIDQGLTAVSTMGLQFHYYSCRWCAVSAAEFHHANAGKLRTRTWRAHGTPYTKMMRDDKANAEKLQERENRPRSVHVYWLILFVPVVQDEAKSTIFFLTMIAKEFQLITLAIVWRVTRNCWWRRCGRLRSWTSLFILFLP